MWVCTSPGSVAWSILMFDQLLKYASFYFFCKELCRSTDFKCRHFNLKSGVGNSFSSKKPESSMSNARVRLEIKVNIEYQKVNSLLVMHCASFFRTVSALWRCKMPLVLYSFSLLAFNRFQSHSTSYYSNCPCYRAMEHTMARFTFGMLKWIWYNSSILWLDVMKRTIMQDMHQQLEGMAMPQWQKGILETLFFKHKFFEIADVLLYYFYF